MLTVFYQTASNQTAKHTAVVVQAPVLGVAAERGSGVDGPSHRQAPSCPACSCPRASRALTSY